MGYTVNIADEQSVSSAKTATYFPQVKQQAKFYYYYNPPIYQQAKNRFIYFSYNSPPDRLISTTHFIVSKSKKSVMIMA